MITVDRTDHYEKGATSVIQAMPERKTANQETPLLLRAEETARLLGLGRSTVFELLATGELPAVRIGRSVRVSRAAVERFIAERERHGSHESPAA